MSEHRHELTVPHSGDFYTLSEVLKLLADPTRLQIFWTLCHREECVIGLAAMLDISSPAISHHLKLLKDGGIITSRREGKEVYYTAANTEAVRTLHHAVEEIMQVSCPERKEALCGQAACEGLELTIKERFSCVHNYIDTDRILRKGAISARLGERVFIPLNMRDGALIGVGLGNPDWNFSAPHGAGRACSRTDAKHAYDLEAYQATMREAGVYTTTATKETLDECPMAYKSPDRILPYLADCVEVTDRLTPVYNFKASE